MVFVSVIVTRPIKVCQWNLNSKLIAKDKCVGWSKFLTTPTNASCLCDFTAFLRKPYYNLSQVFIDFPSALNLMPLTVITEESNWLDIQVKIRDNPLETLLWRAIRWPSRLVSDRSVCVDLSCLRDASVSETDNSREWKNNSISGREMSTENLGNPVFILRKSWGPNFIVFIVKRESEKFGKGVWASVVTGLLVVLGSVCVKSTMKIAASSQPSVRVATRELYGGFLWNQMELALIYCLFNVNSTVP